MRRVTRWLRRVVVASLPIVCALWLTAYAREWLLRRRAERLLADIQALQVNQSTWADVQHLMTRWGAWADYVGRCDAAECDYGIRLSQTPIAPGIGYPSADKSRWLPGLLDCLRLRTSAAMGYFRVKNGVVVSKTFTEDVVLPVKASYLGEEYIGELIVSSSENAKLRTHTFSLSMHPNRSVRNFKGDFGLGVEFTPQETAAEQSALMNFNLNCITRLDPCLSFGDILPAAYSDLKAHKQAFEKRQADPIFAGSGILCDVNPRVLSRESQDVLQVEVLRSQLLPKDEQNDGDPQHHWNATVLLTGVVKGSAPTRNGQTFNVDLPAGGGSQPLSLVNQFPYRELILAGDTSPQPYGSQHLVFEAAPCGTFEATSANLSASQQGVADDFDSDH